MQQRQYRIPNEVTTELKINKMLYLYDLLFLVALIIVRLIALPFIPDVLHLPFTCFLIGFGIFLVIRPTTNPEKRMVHVLYYALIKKKDTYIALVDRNESSKGA
ncbi:hypothetical protein HNY42_15835 (plasmid) [Exiguobacterium sp. Helios]|uniref:DUF5592 family protein n=1 Tax=Exiguobacterium sp. Helios TaxID=2735868 RepID=UPI00165E8E21|nr:DUF5592 family protein [Exiguobacterium sp. Helios]QNR22469.1 hypothetical protein HNY42_15835 [Exiguobacterium sp. Helios]